MGFSWSGYGVLTADVGDLLGISVSGHGDLGTFACPLAPIWLFQSPSTPFGLPSTPKSLTVASTCGGAQGAGSPKALTVVWLENYAYFAHSSVIGTLAEI